jgi:hypothetical protein
LPMRQFAKGMRPPQYGSADPALPNPCERPRHEMLTGP